MADDSFSLLLGEIQAHGAWSSTSFKNHQWPLHIPPIWIYICMGHVEYICKIWNTKDFHSFGAEQLQLHSEDTPALSEQLTQSGCYIEFLCSWESLSWGYPPPDCNEMELILYYSTLPTDQWAKGICLENGEILVQSPTIYRVQDIKAHKIIHDLAPHADKPVHVFSTAEDLLFSISGLYAHIIENAGFQIGNMEHLTCYPFDTTNLDIIQVAGWFRNHDRSILLPSL